MYYIARQAIFDRQRQAVAYELLYRHGMENAAQFSDGDAASRTLLENSILVGLDVLCGDTTAYVNCTRELLLGDALRVLPPARVVLEILEDVVPDDAVLAACGRLRSLGYTLALDDFAESETTRPLLPYASVLKLDMHAHSPEATAELVARYSARYSLVAEKVETEAEFKQASALDFHLFQGYFFRRPEILAGKSLSPARVNYLRVLQEINRPEFDFAKIETIIKSDGALCYRLLRYLNSAAFGLQSGVGSIRHALALLGEREIRRWITLTAVASASSPHSEELLRTALLRARFCELLAVRFRCPAYPAFLVGLFSLMDALLEVPLATLVYRVEIPAQATAALLRKPGHLTRLLELIETWERGDWEACKRLIRDANVDSAAVAKAYADAVAWGDAIVSQSPREAEAGAAVVPDGREPPRAVAAHP